eukprot:11913126-Ditylum_brightwellii.AAC.1
MPCCAFANLIENNKAKHPSEIQYECIPQAMLGMDTICQEKYGMDKTVVFVLAALHQLNPTAFPA